MSGGDREEYIQVPRTQWEQVADLLAGSGEHDERVRQAAHDAGVEEGRAVKLGNGYETGYDLGHDTGSSARQDTRAYVHGILDGWERGCAARHQFVEQMLDETTPCRPVSHHNVNEHWLQLSAEVDAEPEADLEAGA